VKKAIVTVAIGVALIYSGAVAFAETDVDKKLKTAFPSVGYESIRPSPIKGIYEIVIGQGSAQQILYFAPEEGIIIKGQMIDGTSKNLTAERLKELRATFERDLAEQAKTLPLDKAVKTGSGKHVVIEFTDPDCPYCRKAAQFFETATDVTKYTFLMPLPGHPDAENKTRYILCQSDQGKALEEAMKGKLDSKQYEVCKKTEVDELLASHKSTAQKMRISSTPTFVVDGKPVIGADINKLKQLLGQGASQGKPEPIGQQKANP
jgi:thiol:disulfide interchange protein DsbC